jgi:hypothetical protein
MGGLNLLAHSCILPGMNRIRPVLLAFLLLFPAFAAPAQPKASTPRTAVTAFFAALKSHQYDALYDSLPSQFREQLTREQLARSLKRLDGFLAIEKLEIGRLQQRGETAVVDTIIYGRLKQAMKFGEVEVTEGRVNAQQYLIRENGVWKLATADNRSRGFFLKRNPEFSRQFQLAPPQFEFKQGGKWQPIGKRPPTLRSSIQ